MMQCNDDAKPKYFAEVIVHFLEEKNKYLILYDFSFSNFLDHKLNILGRERNMNTWDYILSKGNSTVLNLYFFAVYEVSNSFNVH